MQYVTWLGALAAVLLLGAGTDGRSEKATPSSGQALVLRQLGERDEWLASKIQTAEQWASGTREELLSGAAWRRFAARIGALDAVVRSDLIPDTPTARTDGYRYLAMLLRHGLDHALDTYDPDRPRFEWSTRLLKVGLECADGLYGSARVRDDAVYRIRGRRGTVRLLGFQVMDGVRTLYNTHAGALEIAADGTFEIVAGGAQRPGNWIPLPTGADAILVRQFFYDWDTEIAAELTIERIDDGPRGVPPSPNDPDRLPKLLDAVAASMEANAELWPTFAAGLRQASLNRFPKPRGVVGTEIGAQTHQATATGYFRLAPDEALLIEVTPPTAAYWSLHLGNAWMESLDYANHKTSINGHQAVLDDAGVFRAVIAHTDPGVPNWLDTAGHREGVMIFRWNLADGQPHPQARVVPLQQVRALFPDDTPQVTPAQRAAEIERRRQHVRRRFARPF